MFHMPYFLITVSKDDRRQNPDSENFGKQWANVLICCVVLKGCLPAKAGRDWKKEVNTALTNNSEEV